MKSYARRSFRTCAILSVIAFFGSGSTTGSAQEVPEVDEEPLERGKALVFERCADCHSLQRAFSGRYDLAGWHDAITRMKVEGLEVEPEEQADIAYFLASQADPPTSWAAIGRLHFLFLHFPIALISLLGLFEVIALFQRRRLARDGLHLLIRLAVCLSVPTIIFGLSLVADRATMPTELAWHRNLGILTGVAITVAWMAREIAVRSAARWPRFIYYVSLTVAVVAVTITGDLGGALVHGNLMDALRNL